VPLSLYVHLPWCIKKCPYCDFNSHALRDPLPEAAYLATLLADLEEELRRVPGRTVDSIFFGGGTPSLFGAASIARLIGAVRQSGRLAVGAEITLEANPGAVERGRFAEYADVGVNRISLGVQSFDSVQLQALGRVHSVRETEAALEELSSAGIENFNLDLMYGLPGQSVAAAVKDVEQAVRAQPAHISHYQLTIEPNTLFHTRPPRLPDDDAIADAEIACGERLAESGFRRYEVSAYARDDRICRHNLNYWQFGDYLGVGAGAHGKLSQGEPLNVARRWKLRHPGAYMSAPAPGLEGAAMVDAGQLVFEFMLNALRLTEGFHERDFQSRTGILPSRIRPRLAALADEGLMVGDGKGRWRASGRGFRFLNELQQRFLPNRQADGPGAEVHG
jgi:oxygen-independent coproporphyrinogen-3 oxidase